MVSRKPLTGDVRCLTTSSHMAALSSVACRADPATIACRGVTRGRLLHALLEELIHGLLPADEDVLQARAATLLSRPA